MAPTEASVDPKTPIGAPHQTPFTSQLQDNNATTPDSAGRSKLRQSISGVSQVAKISKSIVRVISGRGVSSGLLVQLFVRSGVALRGLLTNSHTVDAAKLASSGLSIQRIGPQGEELPPVQIRIVQGRFAFSCPLLDTTFVQINPADLPGISTVTDFLPIAEQSVTVSSRIAIFQYPTAGAPSYGEGKVQAAWGFQLLHDLPSDGGAAMLNARGQVVGLTCGKQPTAWSETPAPGKVTTSNVAIDICTIHRAVTRCFARFGVSGNIMHARPLTETLLQELRSIGLNPTESSFVFLSNELFSTSPLYFYRTNQAWYWTPTMPRSLGLQHLLECNWVEVMDQRIRVVGGPWDGHQPAQRAVGLIKQLSASGLKYL
eukprot:c16053_g1_i3.p2 GENE.c16053_g1_i3~~c16053_g1_i3.p2  ORF type:complete len:373 (+),score=70.40 c16053_g1_i3:1358-2476(+)